MDKQFLKENNLLDSVKRYSNILEYVSLGELAINEDDIDPNAGIDQAAGDPQGGMDVGMPGADSGMPGDPNSGMPGADSGMPGDPNSGMPGADSGMPGADAQTGDGVEGFDPQGLDTQMQNQQETNEEDDEEVIDVDDLTDSQENTEKKVGRLNRKFDKLLSMLDSLEANLDANSETISGLKDEIEKRNPTPEEKLSLRSKDGYPFNVSVDDYWKDKEATGNYSTEDDKNGEDSQVYKITKSDIDGINDWQNISKSLDNNDFHMSLKDIMGM